MPRNYPRRGRHSCAGATRPRTRSQLGCGPRVAARPHVLSLRTPSWSSSDLNPYFVISGSTFGAAGYWGDCGGFRHTNALCAPTSAVMLRPVGRRSAITPRAREASTARRWSRSSTRSRPRASSLVAAARRRSDRGSAATRRRAAIRIPAESQMQDATASAHTVPRFGKSGRLLDPARTRAWPRKAAAPNVMR